MTTSKTIAGLIGPVFIAVAAAMLNFGSFPALAEQFSRNSALIFVTGILLFVAGIATVRAHNIWAGGWPVLVTVLGWLAIVVGLARILFPASQAALAGGVGHSLGLTLAVAAVLLGLGAFLSFKAYRSE